MRKFPKLIQITREDTGNGEPWLQVHLDGVADMETDGQAVAEYRLVRVGMVRIDKAFELPRAKPKPKAGRAGTGR